MFVRKRLECIEAAWYTLVHLWLEAVRRSVPSRRYEYLLGRLGAASVLGRLGVPAEDRWVARTGGGPCGRATSWGTIAHSDELLAVNADSRSARVDALGVDVERVSLAAEAAEALRMCLNVCEMERLQAIEDGPVTGFSAKEVPFKYLSAEAGQYFDFLEAEIVKVEPPRANCTCNFW